MRLRFIVSLRDTIDYAIGQARGMTYARGRTEAS